MPLECKNAHTRAKVLHVHGKSSFPNSFMRVKEGLEK